MAFRDMRRMKRLATIVHELAPDLNPRIDRFAPAPGVPAEAVVVDVYEGFMFEGQLAIPAVRLLAWPNGKTWQAVKVVYDPTTQDVQDISEFKDKAYSDASAPRWLFGAVYAFLGGKLLPALLEAFGVEDIGDLPPEGKSAAGPLWLRASRMEMIYNS